MPSKINKENLLCALDSVTWYNGLAEEIVHWKDPGYFHETSGGSLFWNWDRFINFDLETRYQIQIIWIICVILFGDYGTSPRSGCIDDKDAFFDFVDSITDTYRDVKGLKA